MTTKLFRQTHSITGSSNKRACAGGGSNRRCSPR